MITFRHHIFPVLPALIFTLSAASCIGTKNAECGFSAKELELLNGSDTIMRVLTIDNPADEAVLRAKSSDLSDEALLSDEYEKLAELMLERHREGKPFTFYHYMIDLKGGPCIYKRVSGCGSGTEYMAVTPWGDLYPCHQFVGEEAFKLGDVFHGVTNTEVQKEFASCNVYSRPECADCWAKLYCSGGCAANAYHATGAITGVYAYGCDLFRKRMECAIMLEAAKSLDGQ